MRSINTGGGFLQRRSNEEPGSNWTHEYGDDENYGAGTYKSERENVFTELANRMGSKINGLLLLSGDNHVNEIFHVDLGNGRRAPELSSSPFTLNTDLAEKTPAFEGERVWGIRSDYPKGKRGFATLTVQPGLDSVDNWEATIRYHQEAFWQRYIKNLMYVTSNGQFDLTSRFEPISLVSELSKAIMII